MNQVVGQLSEMICRYYRTSFEKHCIELLGDACEYTHSHRNPDINWKEENISANIVDFLRNCSKTVSYDIYVEGEYYLSNEDILTNVKSANSAPRIDMSFNANWHSQRYSYYVEAKNLIEHTCTKVGRRGKLQPSAIQKRYVETGIDNFVNHRYPQPGVLLGYVLEGDLTAIATRVNAVLTQKIRAGEILQGAPSEDNRLSKYQSSHASLSKPLQHYWYKFC